MAFSQDFYVEALTFAARAHGDQKTPTGLPYVVHVSSVAGEVIAALRSEPDHDEDLAVACALLHDVVEDTATTLQQVEAAFGPRVSSGVSALTKNASLPKREAMQDSLTRILAQPSEIAMVKLGDRITNLAPPPPSWSAEKIAAYHQEAMVILGALESASASLAARFRVRLDGYLERSARK